MAQRVGDFFAAGLVAAGRDHWAVHCAARAGLSDLGRPCALMPAIVRQAWLEVVASSGHAIGQVIGQHPRHVQRLAAGAVGDLVPAARAVGDDRSRRARRARAGSRLSSAICIETSWCAAS